MTNKPDPEPTSYFQLEQRRRTNPGEDKPAVDVGQFPPQPKNSPWANDPVPNEPLIDRSREDGNFINMTEE